MKTSKIYIVLLISVLISTITKSTAQDDCFPESRNRLLNDYVGVLSSAEQNKLEGKLVQFAQSTSTQIAVVIVGDLCGYDKADYTYTLAEKWGVGQKGSDNGIMIMVKPTGGTGQRHTFIAVGYGLEGVVPDAIAKRIVETEMIPRFKTRDIYGGIDAAVNTVMSLSVGEFTAEDYKGRTSEKSLFPLIMFVVFIVIMLFSKGKNVRSYSKRNNIGFFAAMMLMSASSRSHRGSYGGFSSGGGGFGGFGGGGFGGGGAGGSW